MKLAVIIPAHCQPDILRLTLGSLLRTHSRHDLDIHVGFHFNYRDYCDDLSIFDDLRGMASVHLVHEIDWNAHAGNINRYSLMHSQHIMFLLQQIRYCTFDYVLLLDNDVLLHRDLAAEAPLPADLAGALFDNVTCARPGVRGNGTPFYTLPKIMPWYLLISRKLYEALIHDPNCLAPMDVCRPDPLHRTLLDEYGLTSDSLIFIDTFAWILHCIRYDPRWAFTLRLFDYTRFDSGLTHFRHSSFNYGRVSAPGSESRILEAYKREFPKGVADLFDSFRAWHIGHCLTKR